MYQQYNYTFHELRMQLENADLKPHLLSMSTTAFSNCNPFSTAVVLIDTYFLTMSEIFRLFQNRLFFLLCL